MPDANGEFNLEEIAAPVAAREYDLSEIVDAPSPTSTFVTHAAQAPAFGLVDELAGAVGAGVRAAQDLPARLRGEVATPFAEQLANDYRTIRGGAREQEKLGEAANPTAAKLGTGAGIGLTILAPLPKGAQGLGGSVAQGALSGLGSSEADLTKGEVLPALRDTAIGGALGYGGHYLGKALGAGASKLGSGLKDFAEKRAAKALGARQVDLQKLKPEQIRAMARQMLDEGVIRFGDRVDDIAPRAAAAKDAAGEQIGAILGQADEAGARFDVDALRERLAKELGSKAKGNPIREGQLNEALNASKLGDLDTSAGFEQIRGIKTALGEGVFPKLDAKGKIKAAQQIAGIMSDEIGDQLGRARGPLAKDALEAANRAFGASSDAARISARGVKALEGNRWFSPSDYGVGLSGAVGGALAGGPLGIATGPLLALAHKLLRERGASSLAVASDGAGRGLRTQGVRDALAQVQRLVSTPEGQAWLRRLAGLDAPPGP
jgi:hypothetical protein